MSDKEENLEFKRLTPSSTNCVSLENEICWTELIKGFVYANTHLQALFRIHIVTHLHTRIYVTPHTL